MMKHSVGGYPGIHNSSVPDFQLQMHTPLCLSSSLCFPVCQRVGLIAKAVYRKEAVVGVVGGVQCIYEHACLCLSECDSL